MNTPRVGDIVELTHHPYWVGTRVRITRWGTNESHALGVMLNHGAALSVENREYWPVGHQVRFSQHACRVLGRSGFADWYRRNS